MLNLLYCFFIEGKYLLVFNAVKFDFFCQTLFNKVSVMLKLWLQLSRLNEGKHYTGSISNKIVNASDKYYLTSSLNLQYMLNKLTLSMCYDSCEL